MPLALAAFDRSCIFSITCLLRLALLVENARLRVPRRARGLRSALRRFWRQWLERAGFVWPPPSMIGRRPRRSWNRTPDAVEADVVRLHVEQPQLGARSLARLAHRVLGFRACDETFRRILSRCSDLVVALDQERRRRPRQIRVSGPRQLWGLDLTVVWVLGILPVTLLAIVDYHGSRVIAFERLARPSAANITRVVEDAFAAVGAPHRLLTDRAPVFLDLDLQLALAHHDVRHVQTRPSHPWTNGRCERLIRTFKETVRGLIWLFASRTQVDRFCADFLKWHNRDRPHASWGSRTPDEVWAGRGIGRARGRVTYFDGKLNWYRFA